jgi:outer membrane protein OmpA-like peptidoglycan-associated protein
MQLARKMNRGLLLISLLMLSFQGFAQNAKVDILDPATIKISELPINTIHSDFGAYMIKDTLFFTSYRDEIIGKSTKKLKKTEFYDLFKVKIDKEGNPVEERKTIEEFCTYYHDGPVSWCDKTAELFITQSNSSEPQFTFTPFQNARVKLRITIANNTNQKWEIVEDFPYNNAAYSVGHPAINETGDTLIFSSDMPNGFGETDLYLSVRENGKWGKPKNLGSRINTAGKDEFPFLTKDVNGNQHLIFSSNQRNGKGGLDVYYTKFNDENAPVFTFGEPINSVNDDFAMTFAIDKGFGYLSSNRSDTGEDDIYRFTFNTPLIFQRELYVYDKNSLKPINRATVVFDKKDLLLTNIDGKAVLKPAEGNECEAIASAFGYTDKSKLLSVLNRENGGFSRDTIWLEMVMDKKIVLRNIYYDFDKWNILPESATELDQLVALMKENPEMKVELGSHTDSRGPARYNQKLSQLRAESAVGYIISKGIEAGRITAKGYGESNLLNNCADGVKCSPAEHRENRRTEIFIPGFGKGLNVKQIKGDYSTEITNQEKESSVSSNLQQPLHEKSATFNPKAFNYYLIFGSFLSKENALKEINNLKSYEVDAEIISDSSPFRVGVGFNQFKAAKALQEKLKDQYPDAWIF